MKYSTLLELQIVDPSGVLKGQLIPALSFYEWGPGAQEEEVISLRQCRGGWWQSPD